MNKLIVVGLLLVSSGAFSFGLQSNNSQNDYNEQMIREQQEQNRIMRQQATDEAIARSNQYGGVGRDVWSTGGS